MVINGRGNNMEILWQNIRNIGEQEFGVVVTDNEKDVE